ncbi:nickel ABC transporter permease subunit NikC [Deltaproteobacteria bacterium Smac51]|nr:nickel ABC transporter permease subunit NikC [Deltaproteobacteria bacterium Smac51]
MAGFIHNRRLLFFAALCLLICLAALAAPLIAPNDPYKTSLLKAFLPPGAEFPLGTDRLGRCLFSRIIYGARMSVFAALFLVGVIFTFGTAVGVISGYVGGRADSFIMRVTDIFLAFPDLVLAIAVAGFLGGGLTNALIALGCVSWSKYARLARSQVLALKGSAFIEAARLGGNSPLQIIRRHILPNAVGPVVVTAALDIGVMMMGIAGLSFLGLGVSPPVPEWGSMLNEGRMYFHQHPAQVFYPGAAIFLTIIVFNLFGDSLRDWLDPRQRTRAVCEPEPLAKE